MTGNSLLRILAACLLAGNSLPASQAPAQQPPPAPQATVETLKLRVLQGQNSVNVPKAGFVSPVVVEVRDQNDLPVEGAEVTFRLPVSGPGGTFPNQSATQTTRSNFQGQAATSGFRPNTQDGRFHIAVQAVFGNQTGNVRVTQYNSRSGEIAKKKPIYKRKLFLAAVAAGAGVGIFLGVRGGSSSTSSGSVILVPGGVTIGAPR